MDLHRRIFSAFARLTGRVTVRTAKLGFTNDRKVPHVIWVEPWACDYTLMHGEDLEVIATGGDLHPQRIRDVLPYFHIVESDGATQVYCEGTVDFKVMQGGRELENGHRRQPDAN